MKSSRILGTAHYVPEKVVTNFDLTKVMETSDEFIVERTGVRTRRHAEANVSATDLAGNPCNVFWTTGTIHTTHRNHAANL